MSADAKGDRGCRNLGCIVVIVVLIVVALILLFFRSLWWEEEGAPVPRGTRLERPEIFESGPALLATGHHFSRTRLEVAWDPVEIGT